MLITISQALNKKISCWY